MSKQTERLPQQRPHWYRIRYYVCVLCGRTEEYRERIYEEDEPKPEWKGDQYIRKERACWGHFL